MPKLSKADVGRPEESSGGVATSRFINGIPLNEKPSLRPLSGDWHAKSSYGSLSVIPTGSVSPVESLILDRVAKLLSFRSFPSTGYNVEMR